jgi:hypothetical protein
MSGQGRLIIKWLIVFLVDMHVELLVVDVEFCLHQSFSVLTIFRLLGKKLCSALDNAGPLCFSAVDHKWVLVWAV